MTKPVATFLALDLETTGLDPEQDQILECAAVVLGPDGKPIPKWDELSDSVRSGWIAAADAARRM